MNLSTLDNIIAVVIIILSLSLVVQSLQAFLKKIFKLKSRQLEQSLVDLFHIAIGTTADTQTRIPFLRMLTKGGGPAGLPPVGSTNEIRVLYDAVIRGFQEIGRVSARGKSMMDSIDKDDLLRVLQRVNPASIIPDKTTQLQQVCQDVQQVGSLVDKLRSLAVDSSMAAKLAALQEQLTPLLNDVRRIYNGQQVSPTLIVADLINLRGLKAAEILSTIASIQAIVDAGLGSAFPNSPEQAGLADISATLRQLTQAVGVAGRSAEAAVGGLGARIKQIEDWYDTVMTSFTERYARSMKTWGIVLGFLVAFALNADILTIYRTVSASSTTRELILQSRDPLVKRLGGTAASGPPEQSGSAALTANEKQAAIQSLEDAQQVVLGSTSLYSSYGFGWPESTGGLDWWAHYFAGCVAMGLLLSVGAPFWEDALESLFGLKNLLGNKSSDTQTSGAKK